MGNDQLAHRPRAGDFDLPVFCRPASASCLSVLLFANHFSMNSLGSCGFSAIKLFIIFVTKRSSPFSSTYLWASSCVFVKFCCKGMTTIAQCARSVNTHGELLGYSL